MVEESNGYRHTHVNGTEFTIKKRHCGTDLSSIARRLAANNEAVTGVKVEHDGSISLSVRTPESFTIGYGNDLELDSVPEDMDIERIIVHNSSKASASITLA